LFAIALIVLLYPASVIAEDGTNLDPTSIRLMALEAKDGVSMTSPKEQKTVSEPVAPASVRLQASVSAFTSSVEETDDTPNITASGTHVHSKTAACPTRYPFGTRIRVAGKEYICEDRMNARYREGNYFDLWMSDRSSAIQWGRRTVEVEVLAKK